MRKMTLLATAFLMTLAAASGAQPLVTNMSRATNATHLPPMDRRWILVCDAEGVCVAKEVFC
jgi:hypothetical protein